MKLERAEPYAQALDACLSHADINTPLRIAHFMAQVTHECMGFKALAESFKYSASGLLATFPKIVGTPTRAHILANLPPDQLADFLYGDRADLGNTQSGDGYRFIGRGFIMLTGRFNYTACAKRTGLPLTDHPELLQEPEAAALAAADYWATNKINEAADRDNVRDVTRLINSALLGLPDRTSNLAIAKKIWVAGIPVSSSASDSRASPPVINPEPTPSAP